MEGVQLEIIYFPNYEPDKKIAVWAVELDVAKRSVAEHVASNADMHLMLLVIADGQYFEKLLENGFSGRKGCRFENDLVVIAGIADDQGWFVLNHNSK